MTAIGALNEIVHTKKALQMALEDAHNTAAELSPARRDRMLALAEHIEDAISMCDRIAMCAKADALTNYPCAFSDGQR